MLAMSRVGAAALTLLVAATCALAGPSFDWHQPLDRLAHDAHLLAAKVLLLQLLQSHAFSKPRG